MKYHYSIERYDLASTPGATHRYEIINTDTHRGVAFTNDTIIASNLLALFEERGFEIETGTIESAVAVA